MDVMVCVWKLLQLSVSPPQIFNLLLQSLQLFFSSTHFSLFLISDQPCHLRATSLNAADQISKDPLTVLHCCLCRALLGHTEREALESVHSLSSYCCLTQPVPHSGLQWDWKSSSTGSSLTDWRRVLTESQTALQQPAVVLKTHLVRLYSLSQLLKPLLSLLDSLLVCSLGLLQMSLYSIVNIQFISPCRGCHKGQFKKRTNKWRNDYLSLLRTVIMKRHLLFSITELYLFLSPLCSSWYSVVVFVFIYHTHIT